MNVAPKFLSGSLAIADSGTSVTANSSLIGGFGLYNIDSPFNVSTDKVKIEEPSVGLFEYGLVQNVLFHHLEAHYHPRGNLIVDVVGPLLDVFPGEPTPFFHQGDDNPVPASPGLLGAAPTVTQASYTDKPSVPMKAVASACGHSVFLKQARSSVAFRAGLVARNIQNPSQLVQLAATVALFGPWWELNVNDPGDPAMAYKITTSPLMTGPLALSPSAPALKLDGTVAVSAINNQLDAEEKEMASRCESVLDLPPRP